MRETVCRPFEDHTAASHVAVVVLVRHVPYRVPRADIGPAGGERHHDARKTRLVRNALHDGEID
jgi:hypothetical protein